MRRISTSLKPDRWGNCRACVYMPNPSLTSAALSWKSPKAFLGLSIGGSQLIVYGGNADLVRLDHRAFFLEFRLGQFQAAIGRFFRRVAVHDEGPQRALKSRNLRRVAREPKRGPMIYVTIGLTRYIDLLRRTFLDDLRQIADDGCPEVRRGTSMHLTAVISHHGTIRFRLPGKRLSVRVIALALVHFFQAAIRVAQKHQVAALDAQAGHRLQRVPLA